MNEVAAMLKATHAQEGAVEVREEAVAVADKLDNLKLYKATDKVQNGIDETLSLTVSRALSFRAILTS